MFSQASIQNVKIRFAISGAAGSGKTYSALSIASNMTNNFAVIDTEGGSSERYCSTFNFKVCKLKDKHPLKYIEAIRNAERFGFEVLIIDSFSHAWFSELELVELAKKESNNKNAIAMSGKLRT